MYIVMLTFAKQKAKAKEYIAAHNAWLEQGFAEGVFLLAGSLEAQRGGMVIAHNTTRAALEARVAQDPFVIHSVVEADILHVTPSKVAPLLSALDAEVAA